MDILKMRYHVRFLLSIDVVDHSLRPLIQEKLENSHVSRGQHLEAIESIWDNNDNGVFFIHLGFIEEFSRISELNFSFAEAKRLVVEGLNVRYEYPKLNDHITDLENVIEMLSEEANRRSLEEEIYVKCAQAELNVLCEI